MLVIDVSINREKLIDSIYIHRIQTDDKTGIYVYRIEKPGGFEDQLIDHRYTDGYLPLLKKAIDIITSN